MTMTDGRRWMGVVVLAALVGSGCRTYGDYDSEEKTLLAIEEANDEFATALVRAEAAGELLQNAAASEPLLRPLFGEYQTLLALHSLYLEEHLAKQADLADEMFLSYRNVSRAYGAIISEQNLMGDLYQEILGEVARTSADSIYVESKVAESRYVIVPPQYDRLRPSSERYLTMESALGGGRGYRGAVGVPDRTVGE